MASLFSSSTIFHILSSTSPKFRSDAPMLSSSVRLRTSYGVSAVSSTAKASRSAYKSYIAQPPSSNASLYDILGVQTGATYKEIKTAYRRLARVLHPDVVSSNGRCGSSSEAFKRITEAYTTLSDAQKRADYDLQMLRTRPLKAPAVNFRFTGYMCPRSWETDQCW